MPKQASKKRLLCRQYFCLGAIRKPRYTLFLLCTIGSFAAFGGGKRLTTHPLKGKGFCEKPHLTALTCTRKAVRRHNRQNLKAAIFQGGVRKQNQAPKSIHGLQLFDKVLCAGEEGFLFRRRTNGYFDVPKLDGTRISAGISCRKGKLLETRKTL